MFVSYRTVLVVGCAVALAFVVWQFILPLSVLYVSGVGVEVPLPKKFVMTHPKVATYTFVVGGPLLFLALVFAFVWLLRLRRPTSGF